MKDDEKKLFKDTVIPVAEELQKLAKSKDESRSFVLVSSEGVQPFILGGYSAPSLDSEEYLRNECPNLKWTSIRPGVLTMEEQSWQKKKLINYLKERIQKQLPLPLRFLFANKMQEDVRMSTVAHFIEEGILQGEDFDNGMIFDPSDLLSHQKEKDDD